jgi:hypothetical protein
MRDEAKIDWSLCTWKGSRRQQHQETYALPLRRKLELIEEMWEQGLAMIARRQAKGLPYFDPETGLLVKGSASPRVDGRIQ